jgi:acyl-CoA thioesterase FadM
MAETSTEPSTEPSTQPSAEAGSDPAPESGAAFAAYRELVRPEWIDFNGHLHDASYATVFADAHELVFEHLGLSADYRTSHDAAMFTVETHIRFLAECSAGQTLTATTTLVDADAKRVRLHSELDADDLLAATGESLYLHVDTATGRTTPLPADRQAGVDTMLAEHAALPRPAHLGLGVGVRP